MSASIRNVTLAGLSLWLLMVCALPARAADADVLKVGVSKVDITPADLTHLNPMGYGTQTAVHDPIFARVLVMGNGRTMVALVSLDLIETGDTLQLRGRIEKELGISVSHIMITATHDHSAPRLGKPTPGSLDKLGNAEFDAYTQIVNDKIFAALKQAEASLQPARLGVGVGSVDVSVNRELYTPQGWREGFNGDGISDKTLWVLKFETPAGAPIAVVFNYAVHSTVTQRENQLNGDLAGAAERFVEQTYGNGVVALWTLGSAGDQIPRINGGLGAPRGAAPARTAPEQSKSGPAPIAKGDAPTAFDAASAQGFMIGAEVVRVAGLVVPKSSSGKLDADETVFTCPLREGIQKIATFHETQTGNVPIRLGLIMVDQVALAFVSGEVTTPINLRLRKASPVTDTIMVTLTNDRTGYYVPDSAYDIPTLEVLASPAARGCAENGIVNGLVDMIKAHP